MKELLGCDPIIVSWRTFTSESEGLDYLFVFCGFIIHSSSNFDFIWESVRNAKSRQLPRPVSGNAF